MEPNTPTNRVPAMTQGKMTGRRGPVPVRCGTTAVGRAKARPKGDRTRATRSNKELDWRARIRRSTENPTKPPTRLTWRELASKDGEPTRSTSLVLGHVRGTTKVSSWQPTGVVSVRSVPRSNRQYPEKHQQSGSTDIFSTRHTTGKNQEGQHAM